MKETNTIKKIDPNNTMIDQFKKEVDEGLSNAEKSLPSKFFYDKTGDALFVKIMHLPEYYVTRSEHEIFKQQKDVPASWLEALLQPHF